MTPAMESWEWLEAGVGGGRLSCVKHALVAGLRGSNLCMMRLYRIAGNVCGRNFVILFKIEDFAVIIFVILLKISHVPFRREHFAK